MGFQRGQKFDAVLDERLRVCDVLLALIGPQWVNAKKTLAAGAGSMIQMITCAGKSPQRCSATMSG